MVSRDMDRKFPKSERLRSRKSIKELFDKSSSFFLYPFKVVFTVSPQSGTDQVLISVSKKKFKRAVDRNRVKRLIREAYRLNKHHIVHTPDSAKLIGFVYVSSDIASFAFISKKMEAVLKRLQKS